MIYKIVRASPDELCHFGIKGQKHGVRRYQNVDGSLTAEGREHYGVGEGGPGMSSGSQSNGGPKSQSFISRHKKGLAIAGGVLAAGLAAVAISQVIKNNNANKRGSEAVNAILGNNAAPAPRMNKAAPTLKLNTGSPVRRAPAANRDVKAMQRNADKLQRQVAKNVKRNQQALAGFDKWNNDFLRRRGY
jgi:hypothetical protein